MFDENLINEILEISHKFYKNKITKNLKRLKFSPGDLLIFYNIDSNDYYADIVSKYKADYQQFFLGSRYSSNTHKYFYGYGNKKNESLGKASKHYLNRIDYKIILNIKGRRFIVIESGFKTAFSQYYAKKYDQTIILEHIKFKKNFNYEKK